MNAGKGVPILISLDAKFTAEGTGGRFHAPDYDG